MHPTKLEEMARVSLRNTLRGNPTIDHSKPSRSRRNEQPIPPPMKNERHKPDNPTETRTIQSRTQTAKQHSELGNSDRTGYRNPESLSTAAAKMPRRSGSPKGSGEVLERDRGSKSPVSFQPPPRGANKIHKSDVVFPIEKAQTNDQKSSVVSLYAPARSNKIYRSDAVFRIEKAKTNDISQTQFP